MTAYQPPTALPGELLEQQKMRAAIAAHDFGVVFSLAREVAKISYSKIAAECDIKPERVGALARGRGSITSFDKIAKIADALRIPGDLLGLAPREWEVANPPPRAPAGQTENAIVNREGTGTVLRREFFKASAGAGLVVGLPDLAQAGCGRRVGSKVPVQLRQRAARLRRLDDVLGGGDTFRVYLGEYQATKTMLRDGSYTEATGHALLSVLSEQAQQAGWAAFDAGKHADASSLYEDSRQAAVESGDASLAGNALAFLAYQRVDADHTAGTETAIQACHVAGPDAAPGVRALLNERLAWTYAISGNAGETERALDAAEAALSEGNKNPQPDWAAWVDRNELQVMTGRCWTELRRPLRAVPVLEDVLARYDNTHARDKSLYLSWLAGSYLAAGEVEQAAAVTGRALELSAGVASVRPRARLAPILRQLRDHYDVPAVADVLERAKP
ncbi:XRE family transcriptional regulator [Streptomyces sp. NPDC060131]|uniref:XRE family transcriptional regulator n=1 Tax=unclassified Streptomyces TaxID=2593676 RepID=UPI003655443C